MGGRCARNLSSQRLMIFNLCSYLQCRVHHIFVAALECTLKDRLLQLVFVLRCGGSASGSYYDWSREAFSSWKLKQSFISSLDGLNTPQPLALYRLLQPTPVLNSLVFSALIKLCFQATQVSTPPPFSNKDTILWKLVLLGKLRLSCSIFMAWVREHRTGSLHEGSQTLALLRKSFSLYWSRIALSLCLPELILWSEKHLGCLMSGISSTEDMQ